MCSSATKKRILILGGGFGGVATARRLERLFRRQPDTEIVLVSRDNFVLMTPLLFEVFSGTLDLKSCSVPIRAFLRTARFIEATVQSIDLDKRVVRLASAWSRLRTGIRPIGHRLGIENQSRNDPWCGARLHVQDPGRRPVAPQLCH